MRVQPQPLLLSLSMQQLEQKPRKKEIPSPFGRVGLGTPVRLPVAP